jgi:hypothetical protein
VGRVGSGQVLYDCCRESAFENLDGSYDGQDRLVEALDTFVVWV